MCSFEIHYILVLFGFFLFWWGKILFLLPVISTIFQERNFTQHKDTKHFSTFYKNFKEIPNMFLF